MAAADMNALGREGWEFVAVQYDADGYGHLSQHQEWIWKRPTPEPRYGEKPAPPNLYSEDLF
jgi:hypothetical protein